MAGRHRRRPGGAAAASEGGVPAEEGVVLLGADQLADSYRPALEAVLEILQTRLPEAVGANSAQAVQVEDNSFSLTVAHRGAEEHEVDAVRRLVSDTLEEYPMLRSVEERNEIHVRPEAGWNRARMVEWITSQLVSAVEERLGVRGVVPIYLGEDPAFRHLSAMGGLDILITGGPAIEGFYLRSPMQVDELLRWLAEQHAAGVTVRGGRLRPPKQGAGTHGGAGTLKSGASGHQGAGPHGAGKSSKRVQISMP